MHRSSAQRAGVLTLELTLLSTLALFSWYVVAHTALLRANPKLISSAIAFDLTLTAALCHWLLGIRLAGLPRWTNIPVVLIGLALCRALLPEQLTQARLLPIAAVAADEALLALQGTANVRITLARPTQVKALLRPAKRIGTLLLQVDEPEAFKAALERTGVL